MNPLYAGIKYYKWFENAYSMSAFAIVYLEYKFHVTLQSKQDIDNSGI